MKEYIITIEREITETDKEKNTLTENILNNQVVINDTYFEFFLKKARNVFRIGLEKPSLK
jgi:hypothetical protein